MALEIDKKKSSNFKRLYRGAFVYTSNGDHYTEETFEVFKEKKDLNLHYDSESLTRVTTGEMLKIKVNFVVNKEWNPVEVNINKTLGPNSVDEIFTYNARKNTLRYSFRSLHDKKDEEISTPPKFHILTPATASSMLFINSKKIDQTSKNYFHMVYSPNMWR